MTGVQTCALPIWSTLMGFAVDAATSSTTTSVGLEASSRVALGIAVGLVTYGAYVAVFNRDVRGYLSSKTTRSSR